MQRGFLPIILIIIAGAVLVIGGGGFWYYRQSVEPSGTPIVQESPPAETEQPKPQAKEQEKPKTTEAPKPAEKLATSPTPPKETPVTPLVPAPIPAPTAATCDLTPRPKRFNKTPYYTGQLFDAHIHLMPDLSEVKKLLCTFNKEKVKGAIGFYFSLPGSPLEKMLADAESIKSVSSGKIRLFLMPLSYSLKTLENIEATNKGLFTGYGEMAFYKLSFSGQSYFPRISGVQQFLAQSFDWSSFQETAQGYFPHSPDEQQFLDLYVLAGKNNFVVMIHPDRGQETAIENILQKNPNVKFYFHGELENDIDRLMDKYPNVYYSIDAILSRVPSTGADTLHSSRTEEEYVSTLTQNFDAVLNGAINSWKTKIEKHPDRFTWGTDRGGELWNYGEEVSRLFEELSRSFIGRLDPSVQEKYAYKNAELLLQK